MRMRVLCGLFKVCVVKTSSIEVVTELRGRELEMRGDSGANCAL